MPDILYPLRYSTLGNIALTATEEEERRSRIRHLLDTLQGERYVYPSFGMPVDALFDASVAELTTERIRLLLAQNIPDVRASVSLVSFIDGKLTLEVAYETGSVIVTLQ